jgi:hypothetical protein
MEYNVISKDKGRGMLRLEENLLVFTPASGNALRDEIKYCDIASVNKQNLLLKILSGFFGVFFFLLSGGNSAYTNIDIKTKNGEKYSYEINETVTRRRQHIPSPKSSSEAVKFIRKKIKAQG